MPRLRNKDESVSTTYIKIAELHDDEIKATIIKYSNELANIHMLQCFVNFDFRLKLKMNDRELFYSK
jgi:hypothetical protein